MVPSPGKFEYFVLLLNKFHFMFAGSVYIYLYPCVCRLLDIYKHGCLDLNEQ